MFTAAITFAHAARAGAQRRRRSRLVDELDPDVLECVDDRRPLEARAVADPHERVDPAADLLADHLGGVGERHLEGGDDDGARADGDPRPVARVDADDRPAGIAGIGMDGLDVDAVEPPILARDDDARPLREVVVGFDRGEDDPAFAELVHDAVVELEVLGGDDDHARPSPAER
jgi:hypothetical protein